uniref:CSON013148 protein n=1 Tax=Culicoides sonorensis TaxID=179676 RepID=A0A336KXY7_CULSO
MSSLQSAQKGMNLEQIKTQLQRFGVPDYIVFMIMLIGCVAIGVYFGFIEKKPKPQKDKSARRLEEDNYLVGGRNMKIFPVAMSLIARSSGYQSLFMCQRYVQIKTVTGVNVHLITPIVCIVCIFYTCVGGMKAVVWTDVIQTIIMFGAMLLICIKGTYDVGGVGVVMQRAFDSGRIETPATEFDLTIRHSYWSLVIGAFPNWLKTNAVSQNMIQRYLSLPTKKAATKALWTFIVGVIFILSICCYSGLLIYATYHDCDPLTTKLAQAKDQLLPLLVMDVLGLFPGLPGLFVAGVFSAALSSLSTGLNSMSAVLLEDFFKPYCKTPLSEKQTKYVMRGVVIVFGTICVALVFVVEHLGSVLQLSISLGAISNGPLLGIFTLGVLVPWVHATGCLWGGIAGLSTMSYIVLRAQAAIATGELHFDPKPVFTHGCTYSFMAESAMSMVSHNTSVPLSLVADPEMDDDNPFAIYKISYLFYTLIGATVTIVVATVVSFCMGANDPHKMDEALFAPFIRGIIRKNRVTDTKKDNPVIIKEVKPIEVKIVQQNSVIIDECIDNK